MPTSPTYSTDDSGDESPPRTPNRLETDFPLLLPGPNPFVEGQVRIYQLVEQLTVQSPGTPEAVSSPRSPRNTVRVGRPLPMDFLQTFETEVEQAPREQNSRPATVDPERLWSPGLSRPAFTVAQLPSTSYRETEGEELSYNYISAQCAALDFLIQDTSVSLNAYEANSLTASIDPEGRRPLAKDALKFCYYLRSIGCDTFASFTEDSRMQLFVICNEEHGAAAACNIYWVRSVPRLYGRQGFNSDIGARCQDERCHACILCEQLLE